MEKNEHAIFLDIPNGKRNGRYHSAILTTYAIDLIHFDQHLINMLHRKQICSVNIFADYNQVKREMEYVNPYFVKNIGKEYSLTCIDSQGAYHPKINFFVGDESVLVVFGTGNLTVTGQGKNHETFTGLMIDESNDSHRPLIEECWRYITRFTNECSSFEKNRILHEIPDNCRFLDSNYKITPHKLYEVQKGLEAALLYNDDTSSVLKQITDIVPLHKVEKVTVVSPFFDENGETLLSLSSLCPKAKMDILIQEDCALPPCKMPDNKNIVFYNFDETARGKQTFSVYDRQLHAKIFHFKTSDKEYCVIGSANATVAGLGTIQKRGVNEEFGIIYVSKKTDFLNELGLKARKKLNCKIKEMKRSSYEERDDSSFKYRIKNAQYNSGKLTIECDHTIPDDSFIAVNSGDKVDFLEISDHETDYYFAKTKLDKVATCYVVNSDEVCLSNKVFINRIDKLETTNPSQTSRNLNRFIARIENEGYDGLEVADMLSDIMMDLVEETDDALRVRVASSSRKLKQKDNALPTIKYNAAYDNDDVHSSRSILVDRTSRLVDCIEDSIKRKIRSIDDALNDEEEEGSAETSNDREMVEYEVIPVTKDKIRDFGFISSSVLTRYSDLISKRKVQIIRTGLNVITKDDLNFFSLSIFTALEICYLNRHNYEFDEIDSLTRSNLQKQLFDSLDRSINIDGLKAVEDFASFCKMMKTPILKDDDYTKKANRTMKYAILFATLFFKNATQREVHLLGNRVMQATQCLMSKFGLPSDEFLEEELSPISERYDYAFRISHVLRLINKLK